MLCKESSKQRLPSGGIHGTHPGDRAARQSALPPCSYLVLCFLDGNHGVQSAGKEQNTLSKYSWAGSKGGGQDPGCGAGSVQEQLPCQRGRWGTRVTASRHPGVAVVPSGSLRATGEAAAPEQ